MVLDNPADPPVTGTNSTLFYIKKTVDVGMLRISYPQWLLMGSGITGTQREPFFACPNMSMAGATLCIILVMFLVEGDFNTAVGNMLWWGLEACWADSVYIKALCHRFWKLTLQVRDFLFCFGFL